MPLAHAQHCTLHVGEQLLDFGNLDRTALQSVTPDGAGLSAGTRSALLTIRCDQPTDILLRVDGQPAGPRRFAWAGHGTYTVTIRNARLDGRPALLTRIGETGGPPHSPSPGATFAPGDAIAATSDGRVAAATVFTAQIDVEVHVAPDALRVRDETELTATVHLRRIE